MPKLGKMDEGAPLPGMPGPAGHPRPSSVPIFALPCSQAKLLSTFNVPRTYSLVRAPPMCTPPQVPMATMHHPARCPWGSELVPGVHQAVCMSPR